MIQSGDTNLMLAGYKMLSEPPKGSDATSEMKNYLFLQNLPPDRQEEFKILLSRTGSIPAAIQVFEKLKSLGTEDRALMLEGMRAIPKVDTNGSVMYLDPVTMQPRATFGKTMSPGEAASDAARQREQSYTLPSPQAQQPRTQSFSVTDPNGVVHNFPTKEAADGFKRAIRGK
jgi:hypothetical protein